MDGDNSAHGFLSLGVKMGEDNGIDIVFSDGSTGEIFFKPGDGNGRIKVLFRFPRNVAIIRKSATDHRSRLARGQ